MVLAVNSEIWILKLKNSDALYYGDLKHPFYLFNRKEEAETYLQSNRLEAVLQVVKASQETISRYFSCSF